MRFWPLLLVCLTSLPAYADFRFVHVTDTHVGAGTNAATDTKMYHEINGLTPRPAFVVNTGDICEVGTDAEYAAYRKAAHNLTMPEYDAPGNHDVRWNPRGKEGYTLGTNQPLYQSWDYENIHFVLLDSTVLLQHWGHFDQAMLDWLAADLARIGHDKPVIIGFHHWIGRDPVMVDNQAALLDVTAPYNVRLWLQGHGHSNIEWNINGAPAIMAQGLYQGSYHIIEVTRDSLHVQRRHIVKQQPVTDELMTIPLTRVAAPQWRGTIRTEPDKIVCQAAGGLPTGATLAARVDSGAIIKADPKLGGRVVELPVEALMAGRHTISVEATLPDGRVYNQFYPLTSVLAGTPPPVWTTNLGGAVQSRLVRDGNALYVTTMGGDLVALDPDSGAPRWRFKTGGAVFSTPHVVDGSVYFGSADHFIYSVDAATGRRRWRTETGGAVFAGAATAQGVVCIASVDKKIYGLDAVTGKVLWTAQGEGMYQSQAATDGQRFFIGGWDNYFRALDVKTGRELWKNKFGRAFYYAPAIGSPTVGDGKVFVTSNDGLMHAMDAATGKVLWEVPGPALGYSGPLFRDGRIYNASLTDTGRVFCFDAANGSKLWETPTGSVIYDSSCAFGGGNVYVGCVDGTFSALRASDGAVQWQYHLGPGHVLASPATDIRRVYIGSLNGQVTALPLNADAEPRP